MYLPVIGNMSTYRDGADLCVTCLHVTPRPPQGCAVLSYLTHFAVSVGTARMQVMQEDEKFSLVALDRVIFSGDIGIQRCLVSGGKAAVFPLRPRSSLLAPHALVPNCAGIFIVFGACRVSGRSTTSRCFIIAAVIRDRPRPVAAVADSIAVGPAFISAIVHVTTPARSFKHVAVAVFFHEVCVSIPALDTPHGGFVLVLALSRTIARLGHSLASAGLQLEVAEARAETGSLAFLRPVGILAPDPEDVVCVPGYRSSHHLESGSGSSESYCRRAALLPGIRVYRDRSHGLHQLGCLVVLRRSLQ